MRRDLTTSAVLATLLAAGGCRMDPPLTHPRTDTRASWREAPPDPATLANAAWFDLYQDDVLRGLIRTALVENPDLGIALARIDEARAIATATGADLYPTVDFSAAAGRARTSRLETPVGDRDASYYAAKFDLSWEIDLFGRVRSERAAARARYFESLALHHDVGIRLVSEVARAYFELRELDELLRITQETLGSRQEYVDLSKVRFEGGKTSEIDFRQAESEYYRTETVLVDVQRQITSKENELSVLLGHAPGAVPRGRRAVDQPLPPAVPAGLPSDLLRRRPDVRALEEALVAETSLVGAARANLYPRIALTGAFGWESDELSELFTGPATTGSLIAGLLQPIFNAGRNRALVEAQCARMRAAMEEYRKGVLVAFQEVEDALVSYRRLTQQRAVQARRIDALAKVLDLAETRYVGGVSQYLEVLDAQRELFDAQIEEADTIQAQLVSLTLLYKALGGGWDATAWVGTVHCAPCAPRVSSAPCAPCATGACAVSRAPMPRSAPAAPPVVRVPVSPAPAPAPAPVPASPAPTAAPPPPADVPTVK